MGARGRGKLYLLQIDLFSAYCVAQLHLAQWNAGGEGRAQARTLDPEGEWISLYEVQRWGGGSGRNEAQILRKARPRFRDWGRLIKTPSLQELGGQ